MKKFLISFLGAVAGIWFSVLVAGVGLLLVIAAAAAKGMASGGAVEIRKGSYLVLDLEGIINDRPSPIDWMAALQGNYEGEQGLNEITASIRRAATDDRIDGIYIDCRGASAGLAQMQAIVDALAHFKVTAPKKWIYAYSDSYTQGDYYVASQADSLFLNPIGQVDVHGLATQNFFFKNLLDKLGIEMQVVKVGTYKSAVEPYILTAPSEASVQQTSMFLNNIWNGIVGQIAKARKVTPDAVKKWTADMILTLPAEELIKMKVVDRLAYRREMDSRLMDLTNVDDLDDLPAVSVADYAAHNDIDKQGSGKGANIAVLYACGEITDSEGTGIVGEEMVPEILDLIDEDDIDGLVMYVNSGGGSAFASEQIWDALRQWKEATGKPFFVSMSDYAASGGYYISCGADRIFAQSGTLTGSIGIFGLIPNFQKLANDKLGVNVYSVETNPGADFGSVMRPMSESEKMHMQAYVERGYDLFTKRCAEGRHMSQDSIKRIAEGRVWDGAEAKRIGLVDELGNLNDAIAAMAKKLNVETWTVREYPAKDEKWYSAIFEAAGEMKTRMVERELGESASLYRALCQMRGMAPVQARMVPVSVKL